MASVIVRELMSEVWVMADDFRAGDELSWSNHVPGCSNILYMDGHVQFEGDALDCSMTSPP